MSEKSSRDEKGQTTLEYLLVILLIALVLFFAFQAATEEVLVDAIFMASEGIGFEMINAMDSIFR